MNVLLTGGMGYIGSHICVELIEQGFNVTIADDLSNSKADVLDRIGIITGKKPAFYKIDVCDMLALDKVFLETKPDSIIHLAGYKCVPESVAEPLKYYKNNVGATMTLIECMKKHGTKQIVFSSSATVYGAPDYVPVPEDAPMRCTNPYGWTKYMSERIIIDEAAANNISAVVLRYFNPIGAHKSGLIGDDPEGVPNNLMPYITQVAVGKREKLYVYGTDYNTVDGTGVRDYIHIDDLAKGHVAALKCGSGAHIYNLGTGCGHSVMQVLRAFEEVNDLKIPFEITDRRPGDVDEYYADASKAYKELGWKAEKNIHDMCRSAYLWQITDK